MKQFHLDIHETINDGSEMLYDDDQVEGGFEAKCGEIHKDFPQNQSYFGSFSKNDDSYEFIEQTYTVKLGARASGYILFKHIGSIAEDSVSPKKQNSHDEEEKDEANLDEGEADEAPRISMKDYIKAEPVPENHIDEEIMQQMKIHESKKKKEDLKEDPNDLRIFINDFYLDLMEGEEFVKNILNDENE